MTTTNDIKTRLEGCYMRGFRAAMRGERRLPEDQAGPAWLAGFDSGRRSYNAALHRARKHAEEAVNACC